MKHVSQLLLVFVTFSLGGCELIGDIFQAGLWVGVILVIGVLALVGWIIAKLFR